MKIKDCFPEVSEIGLVVSATPMSYGAKGYQRGITLTPDSSIDLTVRCPNITCTKQMHQIMLSHPIREALRQGRLDFDVFLECDGWEDAERINRHHCLTKINITGIIQLSQTPHVES